MRVRNAGIAAMAVAAACGGLAGCEMYSLDGLTSGDGGIDASGRTLGDDPGGDDASGPGDPDADASSDVPSEGGADAPGELDVAHGADAADAAVADAPSAPESGADDAGHPQDASTDAGHPQDAATDAPAPYRVVFVTPQTASGGLGTVAAGDALCQTTAAQAGLPGKYLAWLSDSAESPASRMTQAAVPYVLPDRTTVAASGWSQLVSGQLTHAIDQTAQGSTVSASSSQSCNGSAGYFVWTGTTTAGQLWGQYACSGWTSASAGNVGGVGDALARSGDWTQWCQADCNVLASLYCVEQ